MYLWSTSHALIARKVELQHLVIPITDRSSSRGALLLLGAVSVEVMSLA